MANLKLEMVSDNLQVNKIILRIMLLQFAISLPMSMNLYQYLYNYFYIMPMLKTPLDF